MAVTSSTPDREAQPEAGSDASAKSGSPRGARARSREATRARLLESGLELFARDGLHSVTTHDIARGAGVASGTFYLHFKDKRSLFSELAHECVGALRDRLAKAVAGVSGDDAATVRAHAEALIGFAEENRALIRILFSPDTDAAAVGADILNELAASLQAARAEKGLELRGCHSVALSQAVVGMYARVMAWWTDELGAGTAATREEVIETLVRIQLQGTRPT